MCFAFNGIKPINDALFPIYAFGMVGHPEMEVGGEEDFFVLKI